MESRPNRRNFYHSINTVQTQVSQTPNDFSATLVETLRTISDSAVVPVAGLLLTYVFVMRFIITLLIKIEVMNLMGTNLMAYY